MAHQLLIIAYSCDVNQIRDQGARSRPVVAAIMVDIAEWNCRKGRHNIGTDCIPAYIPSSYRSLCYLHTELP